MNNDRLTEPYINPQELLKQVDVASRVYGGTMASTREQELFLLLLKLAQCVAKLDEQINGPHQ